MKHPSISTPPVISFLFTEGSIFVTFLTLDILGYGSKTVWLKYAGILLCLMFASYYSDKLISGALAVTAAADWFLLVRGDNLFLGIILFLCVQFLYALHLHRGGVSYVFPLRLGACLSLILIAVLLNAFNLLNLLAVTYFSQLVSNAILAWTFPFARIFALGLTLFAGCDLCVGLVNAVPLPSELYNLIYFGIWLFYLPSQVLITLSSLPKKEVSP